MNSLVNLLLGMGFMLLIALVALGMTLSQQRNRKRIEPSRSGECDSGERNRLEEN